MLMLVVLFSSCLKDKQEMNSGTPAQHSNRPPVANAGPAITVNMYPALRVGRRTGWEWILRSRQFFAQLFLEKNIRAFLHFYLMINSPKHIFLNLFAGQYAFELTVLSDGGLSSKDTVAVLVTGSPTPAEYNLDVTINGSFSFINNAEYCFDYGPWGYVCFYRDLTSIGGSFNLSPLGLIILGNYEYTDTATNSIYASHMSLSCSNCIPSQYLSGICSINFKQLFQQGGGSFNGTFKIESGSAANNCDPNIFTNLNPLIVTGGLEYDCTYD
jgi:hypothetical protein